MLDRFAEKLSYNWLVDVMPLVCCFVRPGGSVWTWKQVWPGSSNPHWSDTGSPSLKAWFKFPTPLSSLTKILIRLRRPGIYGLPPNILFFDMAGKSYVPISVPADLNDYIEIISSDRTYEWVF